MRVALARLRKWLGMTPPPISPVIQPTPSDLTPRPLNFGAAIEALRGGSRTQDPERAPFRGLPAPPPGVRPSDHTIQQTEADAWGMALDSGSMTATNINVGLFNWATGGLWGEGLFFPGYPYLAELAQRPEYRNIVECIAEEMTRKWMRLVTRGDKDKSKAIAALEAKMIHFNCRARMRRALELDGFMGLGIIYISIKGAWDDPGELKSPLLIDKGKIERDSLAGFVCIDPTWVSPVNYNATNPLKEDFYVPTSWYVMGREVHSSRLMFIRQREVPDIIKPSYNFGGLSLTQISKPYVDNFLRTRQSVSDLIHSFSIFVWSLDMQAMLQDAGEFAKRITAMVLGRDNKGFFMVDKETEDFKNVAAPLAGLDHLQAQAAEQISFPSKIPLVKLWGIDPSGLNQSSDGSIRTFYDHIHAGQEHSPATVLTTMLKVVQLSEVGSIDEDITFEFEQLWELDEAGRAAVEKTKADTYDVLMNGGVVSPEEVRTAVAADLESPFHGLEGPPPEPEPEEAEASEADDPTSRIDKGGAEGETGGANSGV